MSNPIYCNTESKHVWIGKGEKKMDGEKSSFKVSMWSSKVHPRDADQLGYKFKPGQR